jgi:hypothetical protein
VLLWKTMVLEVVIDVGGGNGPPPSVWSREALHSINGDSEIKKLCHLYSGTSHYIYTFAHPCARKHWQCPSKHTSSLLPSCSCPRFQWARELEITNDRQTWKTSSCAISHRLELTASCRRFQRNETANLLPRHINCKLISAQDLQILQAADWIR